MKITKTHLKKLIIEALKETNFAGGTEKVTQARVELGAMGQARAQAGLTDEERGLIGELIALLTKAAKETNIASGQPALKINQLAAVLTQLLGDQAPTTEVPPTEAPGL